MRDNNLWTGGSWKTYALSPPPSPYIGGIGHKFPFEKVFKYLTFHHRGLEEAKKNLLLTVLALDGEAKTREIANRMQRPSTDISRAIAELCWLGVLEKVSYRRYRVADHLKLEGG